MTDQALGYNARPSPLILVVGSSGVGKDAILDAARNHFHNDKSFIFLRRFITRPAEAGGENHIETTSEEFARKSSEGYFSLQWHAHNNDYGISVELEHDLNAGKCVIVNASRTIISEARRRFSNVHVITITANSETIKTRLIDRGRESAIDIEHRLARNIKLPDGQNVYEVPNNGTILLAKERFCNLLNLISLGFCCDESRPTFVK